jgi:thiamine kinase-like enzyme
LAVQLDSNGYDLPSGFVHGDFTFSNILYYEHRAYLIDFTPAYIASPLLDVVKLKQEYKLGWSGLLNGRGRAMVDFPQVYAAILNELRIIVERFFSTYDTRLLEAMNLLRILPYSHDEEITYLLRKNINDLL